jgi:hypothetical protein
LGWEQDRIPLAYQVDHINGNDKVT